METIDDLHIVEELCEKIDSELYLPVKKELENAKETYSLGNRKEDFKILISIKFSQLKQLAMVNIMKLEEAKKNNPALFWENNVKIKTLKEVFNIK